MGTCVYCGIHQARATLISACTDEHLETLRVCANCYSQLICGGEIMCNICSRTILDWAAKLDGKPYQADKPYPWITSWETTFGELYP